ncbi:MAG: O-antigen ligase family protein [Patescibacteria group bacterium]
MKLNFSHPTLNGKDILNLLIEINYLAIIFLIPLYFSYLFPTYNIFDLNKIILFKTLVWLLLFFTGLKFIFYYHFNLFNKENKKNAFLMFKKYLIWPFIFIIGLGLLLPFSINPLQSFFGSYDRQMGFLSYLFYFIWFLLIFVNISGPDKELNKRKINRIIIAAVASSFLVAIYGILQILNIDFIVWSESPFLFRRVTSTLGQPNFLASYLLLVIPLSLYLFIKAKKFLGKFFYLLIAAAQILCLFFTASRGALAALILVVFGFLFLLFLRINFSIFKKIMIALGFFIVIASGLWSLEHFLPGRVSTAVNLQYGSSAVRVIFYKVAISAIAQKPLLGYGLENGSEIYIKYYQPDWGVYGDVGATTDRAHNLILDILLSGGLFALIFFSLLYYQFFYLVKKNIKTASLNSLSLFLGLGVAAYLISLLFSFTIITGEVYFWLFLALLSSINLSYGTAGTLLNTAFIKNKKINMFYGGASILILAIIVYSGINFEKRNLLADYYFTKLYYILAEKKYFDKAVFSDLLLAEKPNKINQIFYDRFLGNKLSDFYPGIDDPAARYIVKRELLRINSDLDYNNYENIFTHAKIYGSLGDLEKSQKYFSAVKAITPFWPFLYSSEGQVLFVAKQYSEAISNYKLALASLPNNNDPRLKNNNDRHNEDVLKYYYIFNREIGNSYFILKDYSQAETFFRSAYQNDLSDFTLLKKIADTYYLRGNLDETIKYNKQGFSRNPIDYNWSLALAYLYHEKNDKIKSSEYLDKALKLAPENIELKNLKLEYSY